MKKYNLPNFNKYFKGDFSGYTNGIASKNRGNAFEIDFCNNFEYYVEDFAKCVGLDSDQFENATLDLVGGQNTRRPLNIKNGKITIGDIKTSGNALADVVIKTNDKSYNASLKFGNSVTFINCGINKLFKKQDFENYKKSGVFDVNNEGQQLLDFFGIEPDKFAQIYINYIGHKKYSSEKDAVDVTDKAKSKEFYDFLKSVIGYNYILIHKDAKNNVHYYDLLSEKQLEDFIGRIQKMEVFYPKNGIGKRVDIVLETSKLYIKFNIRSKDGGVYPTHLMADYTIK